MKEKLTVAQALAKGFTHFVNDNEDSYAMEMSEEDVAIYLYDTMQVVDDEPIFENLFAAKKAENTLKLHAQDIIEFINSNLIPDDLSESLYESVTDTIELFADEMQEVLNLIQEKVNKEVNYYYGDNELETKELMKKALDMFKEDDPEEYALLNLENFNNEICRDSHQ